MSFLAAIWNLYLGCLSLLGNIFLVIVGIGLCGYATAQQLEQLHDPHRDIAFFVCGILLVSFSAVRRIVWTFSGLVAVWGALVWIAERVYSELDQSFAITPELIAIAGVPPLLLTIFLEATRQRSVDTSDLEISLSEKADSEV